MTPLHTDHDIHQATNVASPEDQTSPDENTKKKSGHGWMMIACCIPMLLIAIALLATGVAGPGFLLAAIMCTAMMAMMMRGMSGGGSDQK